MPRKLKLDGFQAELSSVTDLLKQAQDNNDFLGECQFSKRKDFLTNQISELTLNHEKYASVALFFGGDPVLGSNGIFADFAGNIIHQFQELISTAYANIELGLSLGERGPIPLQPASRLMVTGVTRGSFGFVLDEISRQDHFVDTALKTVTEEVARILEKTASSNELEFDEVIENLDDRLLGALTNFFIALDSAHATIRVVEDVADFTLDHLSIARARTRIASILTEEKDSKITGVLVGFLPEHKKFEFKINENLIYGTVSNEAAKQFIQLQTSGNQPIGQTWEIVVKHRTVRPLNRPIRDIYRLMEFMAKIEA